MTMMTIKRQERGERERERKKVTTLWRVRLCITLPNIVIIVIASFWERFSRNGHSFHASAGLPSAASTRNAAIFQASAKRALKKLAYPRHGAAAPLAVTTLLSTLGIVGGFESLAPTSFMASLVHAVKNSRTDQSQDGAAWPIRKPNRSKRHNRHDCRRSHVWLLSYD
jgi:hypothetical protein